MKTVTDDVLHVEVHESHHRDTHVRAAEELRDLCKVVVTGGGGYERSGLLCLHGSSG